MKRGFPPRIGEGIITYIINDQKIPLRRSEDTTALLDVCINLIV